MVGEYLPQTFMKVYFIQLFERNIDMRVPAGTDELIRGLSGREYWWVEVFVKFPLVGDQFPTKNPFVCVYIHIKSILKKFHDTNQ